MVYEGLGEIKQEQKWQKEQWRWKKKGELLNCWLREYSWGVKKKTELGDVVFTGMIIIAAAVATTDLFLSYETSFVFICKDLESYACKQTPVNAPI